MDEPQTATREFGDHANEVDPHKNARKASYVMQATSFFGGGACPILQNIAWFSKPSDAQAAVDKATAKYGDGGAVRFSFERI